MLDELSDMTFDIDQRVKYVGGCVSGDRSGTIQVSFNFKNRRIIKNISWKYPGKLEIAALNEMMTFLKDYPM